MTRKTLIIALGVALLATPLVLYLLGQGQQLPSVLRPGEDDYLRYHNKSFVVAAVPDGGTIDLAIRDEDSGQPTTRLRLWGVDVPQPPDPRKVGADYFGSESAEFTRQLAAGKTVRVELIRGRTRDNAHRLVAYLYLPDGTMINEELIRTGHGYADTRFEHPRMVQFRALEKRAIKAKVGLWKAVRPDQLPLWREKDHRPGIRD